MACPQPRGCRSSARHGRPGRGRARPARPTGASEQHPGRCRGTGPAPVAGRPVRATALRVQPGRAPRPAEERRSRRRRPAVRQDRRWVAARGAQPDDDPARYQCRARPVTQLDVLGPRRDALVGPDTARRGRGRERPQIGRRRRPGGRAGDRRAVQPGTRHAVPRLPARTTRRRSSPGPSLTCSTPQRSTTSPASGISRRTSVRPSECKRSVGNAC